ncbi:MAG: rod shape-determining protein RodA, rod shape determining protein RodA [Candidatus Parcubacteria bacterium]|jgi:rod shape determining protein RodA
MARAFRMLHYLRKFDWVLFGAATLLTLTGLAALYSTSLGQGDFSNFWKQALFAAAGIIVALAIPMADYRMLSGLAKPLYAVSIALLVAVLLFGNVVNGARSWFGVGGFGVQPVELVKLFLVVYLARFFSDYARHPAGLQQILGSGVALAGVFTLVLLQPDFGSALLLLAVWGAMLLVSGIKKSHLVVIAVFGVMTVAVAWLFLLKPYQKDRVLAFADPAADPLGRGYNVSQSVIAIGSGGLFGKGLGFGSQSQLRFLPERQTDFIFAVVGEELGFMGTLLVCGLFAVTFWRGYVLAGDKRDDFAVFLTLGIMASLATEVVVNLGGAMRLIPMTGVTLPFLSYGGSSLLVKFAMIGTLESIAVRK